ncbi:MAG: BirA family biotin operon repressor/biotin-[acetyl-CoA-carboxylase] ligase [Reinekea sp.]|uniref:biotin--[acetyl-CoA-carboxylase] ligase n=1 Tax=Reinekea sp. TaxID=1970455 RepID=UPI003989E551
MDQLLKLLDLLSAESFQSGQYLARKLGVSRASVSTWVSKLQALGVDINIIKGRGYRLVGSVDLIDQARVVSSLEVQTRVQVSHIDVKGETTSTNDDALASLYNTSAWHVYVTELQSSGKGRRGKAWSSPFAQNLMFSMARKAHISTEALYSASLLAGVAVANALNMHCGLQVGLKWPNDIYMDNQKLGGILCEMQGNPQDEPLLVIGIGLNINSSPTGLDYATCSLKSLGVHRRDRTTLLACIVDQLVKIFMQDSEDQVAAALAQWQEYDILKNRDVTVTRGQHVSFGKAQGVDSKGQLLVLGESGKVELLNGGEVSVRW